MARGESGFDDVREGLSPLGVDFDLQFATENPAAAPAVKGG
jgi:hypothetical protein